MNASVEAIQTTSPTMDLGAARDVMQRVQARLALSVRGRDDVIELVLVALLADGHVLLEDYPGSGKTTLAKALGESFASGPDGAAIEPFRRVQFTPDLLPSDITGTTIFDPNTNKFFFRPGPVFAYVVLADEINRTSPKVQAAMLEAMGEKQVTVDNETHHLDELFFVIATQNPLDLAGTFPLPSPQLDRFLFKIRMDHIDRSSELDVLNSIQERRAGAGTELPKVQRDELVGARRALEAEVYVAAQIREALVDAAAATREHPHVLQGVSTRSLVMMLPALQARALLHDRDFVSAEDLEALAPLVFGHRLELTPAAESADAVVRDCLAPALEKLARASLSRS